MLTIIALLLEEKKFEFEYEDISFKMVQTSTGISARIFLRGATAWGFNAFMGDFQIILQQEIQKALMFNVKGRKKLLEYYYDTDEWKSTHS